MNAGMKDMFDQHGARLSGSERLSAEMTPKDGKIAYDLNGLARPEWNTLSPNYGPTGDPRWDGYVTGGGPRPPRRN